MKNLIVSESLTEFQIKVLKEQPDGGEFYPTICIERRETKKDIT